MASDLHLHTAFSDGRLMPEELVTAAKAAKLKYIAITDHDTVDGVCHLYENGFYPQKGINIIPGIEFSANHPTKSIHILGYNVDIYNRELTEKLSEVTESRWERFCEIVRLLKELGYDISETDVLMLAGTSRSISRSHIARILVKKGYFTTVRDAFYKLLERDRPAYVPHFRLEVDEILHLIKAAGGSAVLAHPGLIGDDDLVDFLCRCGIVGLEVFYPQHSEEDVLRYREFADKYGLLLTGGSDFHGYSSRHPEKLGIFTIDDEWAEPFFIKDSRV